MFAWWGYGYVGFNNLKDILVEILIFPKNGSLQFRFHIPRQTLFIKTTVSRHQNSSSAHWVDFWGAHFFEFKSHPEPFFDELLSACELGHMCNSQFTHLCTFPVVFCLSPPFSLIDIRSVLSSLHFYSRYNNAHDKWGWISSKISREVRHKFWNVQSSPSSILLSVSFVLKHE